ncbi:hypothetical protein OEZ60_07410 [Defluviimonas sp. WL0024]|uniref:Uncharacterized protein n=1 Tax=Albidovulum salinarum TaxID=2984153 RepID=A0ABT2X1L5_9RHOB|nr:hypothetical protein [Defluviimonas sp. WL0024]MCU9847831.1 hypothetical protein [Defluviimonas sp. WL0024]
MLLKIVREIYDRHLADPTSDSLLMKLRGDAREERFQRVKMVRDLAYRAIPFVIEPAALDLVATVQSGVNLVEDFGPLLLDAPLPFDSVWMEFGEEVGGKHIGSGVLIQKVGGKILVCTLHRPAGEQLIEPLLFLTVDSDAKLDMRADPFTSLRFISGYEGSQDERVSQFFAEAFPQTGWTILNAVGAMHLIAAKGGPLDANEEPMFSRPERRRLEREGALSTGASPTVTRIRVNAQGQLHLKAVDDEEGGSGGARRRAHRVRGHYMRTARGSSWRKAHIRGLGQVNETVRVIEPTIEAKPSD